MPIHSEANLNGKECMEPQTEKLERNSTLYKNGRASDMDVDNYHSSPFTLHLTYQPNTQTANKVSNGKLKRLHSKPSRDHEIGGNSYTQG